MRLTCPNCGAQYAVDPAVIPGDGRDVQCSSCGHVWFQLHPDAEVALVEEPPVEPALPRRSPDPQVMNILREEAERERAARAAAAAPLESQTELDMPAPPSPAPPSVEARPAPRASDAASLRVIGVTRAGERGETSRAAEPASGPSASRGADLGALTDDERAYRPAPRRTKVLPDIEEINSTLSAGGTDDPTPVATAARRARERQGRRLGFGLAVGFFAALAMLYVQGPRIAAALPAFAPALDAYVATIDEGRRWLDGALRAAVEPIDTDGTGSPPGAES